MNARTETLKRKLNQRRAMLVPGAGNALSARIIEDLGFDAIYLSGAGVTNMSFGIPDLGFIGLTDMSQHVAAVRDAVSLPIIVDADTGFGNAVNVWRTVRALERAGANAIQIEDQVMPKRCGHFSGKEVVATSEMVAKIKAALDALQDGALIIARTDARAVESFDQTMERAARYIEAGADVMFVEALESLDEIRRVPSLLPVPQLINMVVGGKTPIMDRKALAEMKYGLVLYANAALQGAIVGMQTALRTLKERESLEEDGKLLATFAERQRLVQKPLFDAREKRFEAE